MFAPFVIILAAGAAALPQYTPHYLYTAYPGYAAFPASSVLVPPQPPRTNPFQLTLRPGPLPQYSNASALSGARLEFGLEGEGPQSQRVGGIAGATVRAEAVASATMVPTDPQNTVPAGKIFFIQPKDGAFSPKVRVAGVVKLEAQLENLVVSVHEKPDVSSRCQNIGAVYNPWKALVKDGGIITRTASSNGSGYVNLNLSTSKLAGVNHLEGQRSLAILRAGVPLACGIIVSS